MNLFATRRPQHEDVTKIPTPPLQAVALFINFFFPTLALLVVSLRFYLRITLRQVGLDDYLILAALLCSVLMCGPFYMYIKLHYWGWHTVDVPAFDPSPGLWWFYLAQLFYNPVLALVKASVLLFLLRLGGHKTGVRWAIYSLNTFNALQAIGIFLVALLQCLPIHANWDIKAKVDAVCVDNAFHLTISCLTILTDILVLAIPFWIFLGLNMKTPTKLAVIGIFLIGLSVTIISIVRLVSVYKVFYVKPDPNADTYYDISVTLNVVEINLAIISATGPALRPLMRRWFPKWFGGSSGAQYSSGARKYGSNPGYDLQSRINVHYRNDTDNLSHGHNSGIALKGMSRSSKAQHTEIRSISPSGSEEEIMTYNGIMRTTDFRVNYDGETETGGNEKYISRSSSELKEAKEIQPIAI
ncbi:hypothetical protein F5B20DRAFT_571641 [Whalleya microplaca]|nr:hypothetical protein F5B20DRAFT_571641 [Whalleya microplaca]